MPAHQQSHKASMISMDMLQSLNFEKTYPSSSKKMPVAVTSPFINQICTDLNARHCWSSSLQDIQPQEPESNHAILSVATKDSKSDLTLNCNSTSEIASGKCLFKFAENSLENVNQENHICQIPCTMAEEAQSHPPESWKKLSMVDLSENNFKYEFSSGRKGDNVCYVSLQYLPTVHKEFREVALRKPLKSDNDDEIQCAVHMPTSILHPSSNMECQHLHPLDDTEVDYRITLNSSDTYSYCASLFSEDAGLQQPNSVFNGECKLTESNTSPTEKECDTSDLLVQTSHHDSASSPLHCEHGAPFSPCSSNESGYYGYNYLPSSLDFKKHHPSH